MDKICKNVAGIFWAKREGAGREKCRPAAVASVFRLEIGFLNWRESA